MLTILVGAAVGAVFLSLLLTPPEIYEDTLDPPTPDFRVRDADGRMADIFITRPKPTE